MPFDWGNRRCPSAAFANLEMLAAQRTIPREFRLTPTDAPAKRWHDHLVAVSDFIFRHRFHDDETRYRWPQTSRAGLILAPLVHGERNSRVHIGSPRTVGTMVGFWVVGSRTAVCRCAHDRRAHDHYRSGHDCGVCDCASFRRTRRNARIGLAKVAPLRRAA